MSKELIHYIYFNQIANPPLSLLPEPQPQEPVSCEPEQAHKIISSTPTSILITVPMEVETNDLKVLVIFSMKLMEGEDDINKEYQGLSYFP